MTAMTDAKSTTLPAAPVRDQDGTTAIKSATVASAERSQP